MKKRKMTEELASQMEQQSSEDAELWTQESTPIEARPTRTSVLSLRLPTAEFHALLRAARSAGESVSEYVRNAIVMRQTLQPMSPTVNITGELSSVEFSGYWGSYTRANPQLETTPGPKGVTESLASPARRS